MDDNNECLGISIDEACKLLGIGRNLMLKLVHVQGFPAIIFKRKIIINKKSRSALVRCPVANRFSPPAVRSRFRPVSVSLLTVLTYKLLFCQLLI